MVACSGGVEKASNSNQGGACLLCVQAGIPAACQLPRARCWRLEIVAALGAVESAGYTHSDACHAAHT